MQHLMGVYDSRTMVRVLDAMRRAVQCYMTYIHQHTISLRDVIPSEETMDAVKRYMRDFMFSLDHAYNLCRRGLTPEWRANMAVDRMTAGFLGNVATIVCSMAGEDSGLSASVRSGAKGSEVNQAQFVCIGQQFEHGRRPLRADPFMASLPSFADGREPKKRGLILNGLLGGLDPIGWWNHTRSGRISLADTAVGTRAAGTSNREFRCGEQSVVIAYDGSVRSSDGFVFDMVYGGDNADGCCIQMTPVPWVQAPLSRLRQELKPQPHDPLFRFIQGAKVTIAALPRDEPLTATALPFQMSKLRDAFSHTVKAPGPGHPACPTYEGYLHAVYEMLRIIRERLFGKVRSRRGRGRFVLPPLPAPSEQHGGFRWDRVRISYFVPHMVMEATIMVELHPTKLLRHRVSFESLGGILRVLLRSISRSRISPGEMAGLVAAYSKGEHNTQMTLNTFHLTGVKHSISSGVERVLELQRVTQKAEVGSVWHFAPWIECRGVGFIKLLCRSLCTAPMRTMVNRSYIAPVSELSEAQSGLSSGSRVLLRGVSVIGSKTAFALAWVMEMDVKECEARGLSLVHIVARMKQQKVLEDTLVFPSDCDGSWCIVVLPMHTESPVSAGMRARERVMLMSLQHNLVHAMDLGGVEGVTNVKVIEKDNWETGPVEPGSEGCMKKRTSPEAILWGGCLKTARFMDGTITDFRRCFTDNVQEATAVLGIEAGCKVYMREMMRVIGASGFISARHIQVSSSIQTWSGNCLSLVSAKTNVNSYILRSIQKQPMNVFAEASFLGSVDKLNGPSAIVMGKVLTAGTHACDVVPCPA